ncbi:MAG: serine/threonine-protein phosphatase, partial [Anaerolineales bacterium]|nr:serine/threonine-protein phosphatase [Anaerolineales bacterium]
GERASSLAVQTIREFFTAQKDVKDLPAKMAESIRKANEAIVAASQADDNLRGMGTTIVMVGIVDDRLYTAYVGDSRIYLLRGGRLQQLTVDHTWAQEAIEAGLLTRAEAKNHPNRNVIKRYLGGIQGVEVDHRLVLGPSQTGDDAIRNQGARLRPGDVLILNSDGLSDMIDDSVIQAALEERQTLQSAVDVMIDKANEAGGKDNITVVTVGIPGADGIVPIEKAPAAAAPAPAEPTPRPALAGTTPARALPWALAGILGILLVLVLGAVAVYAIWGGSQDDQAGTATQPAAATNGADTPDTGENIDVDARATAGNLSIEEATAAAEEGIDPLATPVLVPTLAETLTSTPSPRPVVNPTSTPDSVATSTPETTSGGGSSGGGGSNPPPPTPTNTRATVIEPGSGGDEDKP